MFARQSQRLLPVLQALLKHLPSRRENSQALSRIEQVEESHARLELVVVAREFGRKLTQEGAQHVFPLLSQVIDVSIRATRLPLHLMVDGAQLLIPPQRRVEVIAVERLAQDSLDLPLEFIAVVGAGTEFGQDQNIDVHERLLLSIS